MVKDAENSLLASYIVSGQELDDLAEAYGVLPRRMFQTGILLASTGETDESLRKRILDVIVPKKFDIVQK